MDFKNKILNYLKIDENEYRKLTKPISEIVLPSCDLFHGMDKAANVIKSAMENNEKIVIYGDYDCDGVMATSILVKCFKILNYNVGYYLPSRYLDGYGLNEQRVVEMSEKGYSLIITVDNGITQFEAIKKAYELGMKVIVTDHHVPQGKLPTCETILHPLVSNYGKIICCGAYVSFMLASKLLNQSDEYLLSLACIATISDMMELKEYNRDIVRLGISFLNKNHYLPIDLLAENAIIDENIIGLKIAPKINAMGRMIESTSHNRLVTYFTSEGEATIRSIYQLINAQNEKRKELTKTVVSSITVEETKSYISLICEIKEGLIGLVANNLMEKYHKPTFVFTIDSQHPNIIKGSARARKGFNISEFLLFNKDILLTSGGHELAGGLSLYKENYGKFLNCLNDYASSHLFEKEQEDYIEIEINDINESNYCFLRSLAPFGEGFKLPLLMIKDIKVENLRYSKSKEHILYPLGVNQKIIGFNYAKTLLDNYDYINIYGYLGYSTFNHQKSFEFNIKRITNRQLVEIK